MSDERTERGTAALVAGVDRYVVGDILVFIVRRVVFQDNKRVVTSRVPLMNGSHQSYIRRGWRPSWIVRWRWRIITCGGAQHPR